MTDSYYGYVPPSVPAEYDRYMTFTESGYQLPEELVTDLRMGVLAQYTPPASDVVDVEDMWFMVKYDNPSKVAYLSLAWWRASELLRIASDNLRRQLEALASKWESPQAKQAFLRRVGGTLYSLDEWRDRASRNSTYLSTIASQFMTSKREIHRIYTEYVTTYNRMVKEHGDRYPDLYARLSYEKTREALPHMVSLAGAYTDGRMSQGSRFKGRTNAKITTVTPYGGSPPVVAPTRPGGAPPTAPTVSEPPPAAPPQTTGNGPILQNGVITAPPPTTPAVQPLPATIVAAQPGAVLPPGGLANPFGSRVPPVVRPPVIGSPPTGVPPAIRGRNAATPANPPGLPPSRQGGHKPGTANPNGAVPPGTRRASGAKPAARSAPPVIGQRSTPAARQPTVPGTPRGPRVIGGRTGGATRGGQASVPATRAIGKGRAGASEPAPPQLRRPHRSASEPSGSDRYAGEELWTVDTPGDPVIAHPPPRDHRPTAGPALGH